MKVNNITKHPTDKATIGGVVGWVSVVEGQLVLIKHESIEKQGKPVWLKGFWNFLPIVISLTEKIEDGDWVYYKNGSIEKTGLNFTAKEAKLLGWFKILVLSEQFSEQQLQMIVDGKLKHGDKVLVECEVNDGYMKAESYIKFNDQNHCVLHQVEEKTYTQQQVDELLDQQAAKTTAQMLEKQKDMFTRNQVESIIRQVYTDGYERGNAKLHWSGEIDKAVKEHLG